MAEPKIKPMKRVAGKSKFRLPERSPRPTEESPLREILREAKAQEEALTAESQLKPDTPATENAGVSNIPTLEIRARRVGADTPATVIAGVSRTRTAGRQTGLTATHTFAEFSRRWSPVLRAGQLSVCRVLFEQTYAIGATECFTSMPRLAAAAGLKERQCYNVIGQLELFGFVERPDIYNTQTQKGTVFRLHLEPRPPTDKGERRYHIGGKGSDDTPAS